MNRLRFYCTIWTDWDVFLNRFEQHKRYEWQKHSVAIWKDFNNAKSKLWKKDKKDKRLMTLLYSQTKISRLNEWQNVWQCLGISNKLYETTRKRNVAVFNFCVGHYAAIIIKPFALSKMSLHFDCLPVHCAHCKWTHIANSLAFQLINHFFLALRQNCDLKIKIVSIEKVLLRKWWQMLTSFEHHFISQNMTYANMKPFWMK